MKGKKINYRLLTTIFACISAFLLGLLISKTKVNATNFPNSNVKYNEQVKYCRVNGTDCISIYYNQYNQYYYMIQYYTGSPDYNYYYKKGTYNNGTITFTSYTQMTGNSDSTYNSTSTYTINSDTITISNKTYTFFTTGYTEAEYLAYGQQRYNAGVQNVQDNPHLYGLYTLAEYSANYTAGQNSVLNDPNTYNLYTSTQYTNYGTTQYNSGYSTGSTAKENDILTNPNNYGLYSSAQYTAYGTSQYNAGIQQVQNNPHTYNLYTSSEYNAYGTAQYNAGFTGGQNDVINNPHSYNLYTSSEYNANYTAGQNAVINDPHSYDLYTTSEYNTYGTNQYNAGYLAGLNDNEAYQLGIQHVINNPHYYNLYTESEYNTYGTSQYNAGIQYVLDNWEDYDLYNQVQYDTYGQEQYNSGYTDGINTYSPTNENPTFNIRNYSYVVDGGGIDGATINDTNNNVPVIDFSDYAPYSSYTYHWENAWYLESFSTEIVLNQSYSANSTFYLPVIDSGYYGFTIKFCDGFLTYQNLGDTYTYCKSIAKNHDDTLTGNYYGLYSDYYNDGISYYDLIDNVPIENNFYILDLSEYLVSDSSTFNVLLISYSTPTTEAFYNAVSLGFATTTVNQESYSMGYKDGFNIGNQIGLSTRNQSEYSRGYSDGLMYSDANGGNTLVGVVGAVATTPVTILTSIFNFEFLGINVAAFILSIMTLLVVVWLIKRFI